jgi:hypothetical protein
MRTDDIRSPTGPASGKSWFCQSHGLRRNTYLGRYLPIGGAQLDSLPRVIG